MIDIRRWVLVTAVAATAPAALAQVGQEHPGPRAEYKADATVVHEGERVDPATYGPGIVESMDEVLERAALLAEGLTGDKSRQPGQQGLWAVPSRKSTDFPHSGIHYAANKWGDTRMGIGFGRLVDVESAFFAAQGNQGVWTTGVRAVAYRDGVEVGVSDWLRGIDDKPKRLDMNFSGVDRIVIEAEAVVSGAGWYALDDLSFTPRADEGEPPAERIVIDFEDLGFNTRLSGSGYAGLTWETGHGEFVTEEEGVHAPIRLPDDENDDDGAGEEPAGGAVALGPMASDPVLEFDFQGIIRGDAGSFSFPPDTCGAIGPQHFVEVANRNFSVYAKLTGTRLINVPLGTFLPGSNGDPRVLFDQHSGRWVVIVPDFNTRVYLAVSETDDPTGNWFKTSWVVSADEDDTCWPDYPTLGVDADGIYVASYMVGCSMSIFALDKAPLIAGMQSLGTITAFRLLPYEGAIQPVHAYGATGGEYFISRGSSTTLRVRQLAGDIATAPTLNELGFAPIASHAFPPDVPALESTVLLDSVGHRLMNAVYRDGAIWTAHTVDVDGRAAARWYQVNVPTLTVPQTGTIADTELHYFFPSITVNVRGDAAMGFSGSSANQYAACYFSGRGSNDIASVMSAPQLLQSGAASQNNFDGFGRNRWGDYSLTTLDPSDELTFWTVQEYAHATDIWGTWIGEISVLAAPANNFCNFGVLIQDGAHPFDTVNATTDGLLETNLCGAGNLESDVWYVYFPTCTGDATLTLSGFDYDARVAMYPTGACPGGPDEAIACLQAPGQTEVTVPVTQGSAYRIRIGGFGAAQGTGMLTIGCVVPCSLDCVGGDGNVDVADLLQVLAEWGTVGPHDCDVDPSPGGNGTIDIGDLLAVLAGWGPC